MDYPDFWLTELLTVYIRDTPLVAKGIDFQIQNNDRKLAFYRGFSSFYLNNIFLTSWFFLKQLALVVYEQ